MRKTTCRGCGRILIFDDDRLQISHEAPECERFKNLIANAREKGIGPEKTEVTLRDPITGEEVS